MPDRMVRGGERVQELGNSDIKKIWDWIKSVMADRWGWWGVFWRHYYAFGWLVGGWVGIGQGTLNLWRAGKEEGWEDGEKECI